MSKKSHHPVENCDKDETPNDEKNTNPYDNAGLFSLLLFKWLWPLFIKGTKSETGLNPKDIYPVPCTDQAKRNADALERYIHKNLLQINKGFRHFYKKQVCFI
jgi:hypothetical protein